MPSIASRIWFALLLGLYFQSYASAADPAYEMTMIIYTTAGNPFWPKVIAGAEAAAAHRNIKLNFQYGDNDPVKQNDAIQTAVVTGVDALAVVIADDDAYDRSIAEAVAAGIPVIAFNIDDSRGAEGNARLAYVGQSLDEAGYRIARHLIELAGLKSGDKVVCPVELPEATYAIMRFAGARRAFEEQGIETEMLDTGAIGMEDTLTKLTQYLFGHADIDAVLGLGGMPTEMAPQAIRDAGLEIPNAGFDITPRIARNIKQSLTLATIDQQPFYQGFMTISLLYYKLRYDMTPFDIHTGLAIVDASNVDPVIELGQTVR